MPLALWPNSYGANIRLEELNDIIIKCRAHDRKGQEKLYRMFYPALFALCRQFFEDKHEVLSALNDGMLKVFKNIDQYDPSKGDFFNWAYTVVRNAALTLLRSKKNIQTEELNDNDDPTSTGPSNPFKQLEWKDIYVYLSKLPTHTRAVSSLFYLEGFSVKEIASGMNIKEGTVKWHLSECRTKLKLFIKQPETTDTIG